ASAVAETVGDQLDGGRRGSGKGVRHRKRLNGRANGGPEVQLNRRLAVAGEIERVGGGGGGEQDAAEVDLDAAHGRADDAVSDRGAAADDVVRVRREPA